MISAPRAPNELHPSDRRVLVTGAFGSVGRDVVREFASKGWEVIALASKAAGITGEVRTAADGPSSAVSVQILDISAPEVPAVLDYRGRIDAVVHLAAVLPGAATLSDDEALERNLAMVRWALRAAEHNNTALVFASSAFIHDWQQPPPYSEQSPLGPPTSYHRGKVRAEELCAEHAARTALPTACLRISAPYGPRSRHRTVLTRFVDAARAGGELRYHGSGARTQDFVNFDDVATAFRLAVEARANGAFLVASGKGIGMRELAERVVELAPATGARVVASGEPDPQEECRWVFDCARARDTFGFFPRVSLDEGLIELLSAGEGS